MGPTTEFSFKEKNQSFWQLGLILGSGLGLVSMVIGGAIAKMYGSGIAFTSILLGNFILWFIGLGIISMTGQRSHAVQNIKESLGRFSSFVAAIILVAAFLVWYALQIKVPTESLSLILGTHSDLLNTFELRVSAFLGFACALIGMGGIKIIKWINISSFPFLILFLICILYKSGNIVNFKGSWGISLGGILLVVLTWFPGTINLSTFFRHSRSRADSLLGLSLMTVLHIIFQCAFLFINISDPAELVSRGKLSGDAVFLYATIGFVVLSFFCVNLLNIYWASIGWEVFFSDKQESKSYAVIGLLGTVIYMFFQSTELISFIEALGTTFIANLGVILISGYIVKQIVKHRVRKIDRLSNSICWFAGCTSSAILLSMYPSNVVNAILGGVNTCLIVFAAIIFAEEIGWSIKHMPE
jgi:hypothetical protein